MSDQNNEIPNGFKKTEIGIIPEDWEVVKLEELNIKNKKTINPAKYPDELFEYYSIPAYQENKKPIIEKGCNIRSQKILLKNGTVLFGKLNPRVEKVWLVSSKNNLRKIGSTEWLPIYPNIKKVNPIDLLTYLANNIDLLIGMRLHAIIFAHIVEKPVIAINYDVKVYEFTLKEIAQELGISRERVRQLKEKGLRRMRVKNVDEV